MVCARGPMSRPGAGYKGKMSLSCRFYSDIAFLFPYINATAERAELYDSPTMIRLLFQEVNCVLYPNWVMAAPIDDREHARSFMDNFAGFLNDINRRKKDIAPKHKLFRQAPVPMILRLLPQNNCGECGFTTCMAFAANLAKQQTAPEKCPYLGNPTKEEISYPIVDENGKLVSTVTIDVDTGRRKVEQQEKMEIINRLGKKIRELSGLRKESEKKANQLLPVPLSRREIEILRLVSRGATNSEISEMLHISAHTVKSHVIHIFNKLGVDDRTQAAVWAAHNNLV